MAATPKVQENLNVSSDSDGDSTCSSSASSVVSSADGRNHPDENVIDSNSVVPPTDDEVSKDIFESSSDGLRLGKYKNIGLTRRGAQLVCSDIEEENARDGFEQSMINTPVVEGDKPSDHQMASVDVTPTRAVPGRKRHEKCSLKGKMFIVTGSDAPETVIEAQSTPVKYDQREVCITPTRTRWHPRRRSEKCSSHANDAFDGNAEKLDCNSNEWDLEKAVLYIESPEKPLPDNVFPTLTAQPISDKRSPKNKRSAALTTSRAPVGLPTSGNVVSSVSKPKKRAQKISRSKQFDDNIMKFMLRYQNHKYSYLLSGCIRNSETFHRVQQRLALLFTGFSVGSNFNEPICIDSAAIRSFKCFVFNANAVVHTRKFNPNCVQVCFLEDGISSVVPFGERTTVGEICRYCEWLFGCRIPVGEKLNIYIDELQVLNMSHSCADVVNKHGNIRWFLLSSNNSHCLEVLLPLEVNGDRQIFEELLWVPISLDNADELNEHISSLRTSLVAAADNLSKKKHKIVEKIRRLQEQLKAVTRNIIV